MSRLRRWAPCVLGGVAASAAFVWFLGYGAGWIASSGFVGWFFGAEWPMVPPCGWVVAAILGYVVADLCHLARGRTSN